MRRLIVVALLALPLGCQQSPAPGPLSVPLRQEADELAGRGEYEAAVAKYRAAANQDPDTVSLRFALGTALSHLGRRQETIAEFRFVVSRGNPGSPEVEAARGWLVSAGELAPPPAVAPSQSLEQAASPATAPAATSPTSPTPTAKRATVKVRTQPRPGTTDVNLALMRQGSGALGYTKRVKLGEAFEWSNVLPGKYRLTVEDALTSTQIWDQEVAVALGTDLVLDLK